MNASVDRREAPEVVPPAKSGARAARGAFLHGLQALRGVAALAVVISHIPHWNRLQGEAGSNQGHSIYLIGTGAVYVFFVISGFVIAHAHAPDFGKIYRLPGYLIKRSFRIYPAYLAIGAVNVFCAYLAIQNWDHTGAQVRTSIDAAAALTLLPLEPNNPYCSLIGVGWSLFYEIVFYILIAIAFIRARLGDVVIGIYLICCIVPKPPELRFFWLDSICGLFAAGYFMSRIRDCGRISQRHSVAFIAIGGIVAALAPFNATAFRGEFLLCAGTGAVLLVQGCINLEVKSRVARSHITASLLWLGKISYSLYLCHNIVQALLFRIIGAPNSNILKIVAYCLMPIPVAAVSYQIIERPAQNAARWIVRRISVLNES